jgi:hypothetical protein
MIFVQKDWIDSLAIQNIVKSFDGSKEFGDVYARLK